jgi:3-isopropylmalate/(R)-2-methylmalate dehydratase small subunit
MSGRAWVFGDNLDTDVLVPGRYMKFGIEEIAKHCLESVRPDFASNVKPGDVLVGGRNLGMGSSREQAPQALKYLGISALIAPSVAGLFYRNAVNLGLPVLICAEARRIGDGHQVDFDAAKGRIRNLSTGEDIDCEPIPPHLLAILDDGGLMPHLERRLARERSER